MPKTDMAGSNRAGIKYRSESAFSESDKNRMTQSGRFRPPGPVISDHQKPVMKINAMHTGATHLTMSG